MSEFFRGQVMHALSLLVLIPTAYALAPDGGVWFDAAIWIAVVHQVYGGSLRSRLSAVSYQLLTEGPLASIALTRYSGLSMFRS